MLTKLDEKVLPFLSSPLVLADFLTQSYNIGMIHPYYIALNVHTVLQHQYALFLKCWLFTWSCNIGMLHPYHIFDYLDSSITLVCSTFTTTLTGHTVLQHWYALFFKWWLFPQSYDIGLLHPYHICDCSHSVITLVCSTFMVVLTIHAVLQHWYTPSLPFMWLFTQCRNIGMLHIYGSADNSPSHITLVCSILTTSVTIHSVP